MQHKLPNQKLNGWQQESCPSFAIFGCSGSVFSLCNIMKYSPQQQQKERKSESDVASVIATPSRTSRSRNSTHGCSSNRIINNTISTGIFAWMRVFRMASLLHQIGC
ncbi:uncharacterized protein LOC103580516 [Microplitis demolitor]|uniref:uncharacterized protein LOC103580516 n=1 Tax=Microplitis demolitor TaxID=69319 RepID=UPI0004CDADF2|nr:uncharacterized protein LOC103580516 [Microplitis demolitor]